MCNAKDQIRISKESYPVGDVFGVDIYEATHMRTNQKIYVTIEGNIQMSLTEKGKGLWHNIHMRKKTGRRCVKKVRRGAPTPDQMARAKGEAVSVDELSMSERCERY